MKKIAIYQEPNGIFSRVYWMTDTLSILMEYSSVTSSLPITEYLGDICDLLRQYVQTRQDFKILDQKLFDKYLMVEELLK